MCEPMTMQHGSSAKIKQWWWLAVLRHAGKQLLCQETGLNPCKCKIIFFCCLLGKLHNVVLIFPHLFAFLWVLFWLWDTWWQKVHVAHLSNPVSLKDSINPKNTATDWCWKVLLSNHVIFQTYNCHLRYMFIYVLRFVMPLLLLSGRPNTY